MHGILDTGNISRVCVRVRVRVRERNHFDFGFGFGLLLGVLLLGVTFVLSGLAGLLTTVTSSFCMTAGSFFLLFFFEATVCLSFGTTAWITALPPRRRPRSNTQTARPASGWTAAAGCSSVGPRVTSFAGIQGRPPSSRGC
jgi:hypothetical protein